MSCAVLFAWNSFNFLGCNLSMNLSRQMRVHVGPNCCGTRYLSHCSVHCFRFGKKISLIISLLLLMRALDVVHGQVMSGSHTWWAFEDSHAKSEHDNRVCCLFYAMLPMPLWSTPCWVNRRSRIGRVRVMPSRRLSCWKYVQPPLHCPPGRMPITTHE